MNRTIDGDVWESPTAKNKKCLLTISLLVSNSITTIHKCLESLRPLLEQVDSELIIVDTVGAEKSDGSLEVAKKYADKIIRFEWCDDFAAARNAGLKLAQGEWFLFIDDDEWFDNVDDFVAFFKNKVESKKYNTIYFNKHNYQNLEGTIYREIKTPQCIKLFKGLKFEGRIHERFSLMHLPFKHIDAFVHHYGYVGKSSGKKLERNEKLLKEALIEDPQNMHMWAQLLAGYGVKTEEERKKVKKEAVTALKQFEQIKKQDGSIQRDGFTVFAYLLRALIAEKKWKTALEVKQEYEPLLRLVQYECCILDNLTYIIFINSKRENEAVKYVLDYVKNYHWLQKHKEEYLKQESFYFKNDVSLAKLFGLSANLLIHEREKENWQKILHVAEKLPWAGSVKYINQALPIVILAAYHENNLKILQDVCEQIADKGGKLPVIFGIAVRAVKEDLEVDEKKFVKFIAKLQSEDAFILIQRALDAERTGMFTQRMSKLQKAQVKCTVPYDELFSLLIRNKIDPTPHIESLAYEEYLATVNQIVIVYAKKRAQIPAFAEQIEQVWDICSKRELLLMSLRHKYLFSSDITTAEIKNELGNYADNVVNFAQTIYLPELLEGETSSMLPSEIRFGIFVQRAIAERKAEHEAQYLADLRQGLKYYEAADRLIKRLLREYDEKNQKQQQVNAEMARLGSQVKVQVLEMLQRGENKQAEPLILELAELLPGDLEVKKLWVLCHRGL
ncbi:glycosyltransferase [Liquorilactobacillus uvarum]|uniref:Glycosyl transferase family 2 n=1 Tax=Liquorilactobacillus uvarum DSM 19971 TaxID=1423812 RepID=A0A0R1PYI2_9LACO|nr:glycosyltransferase [Liquorilactobacillus uvarum]KRL37609.1 glycosyl transferase family 2 [Liquorilactobacillus uvarum DSM 19971]